MTVISSKKHVVLKLSPTGKFVLAWKPEEDKRKPRPRPPEPGGPPSGETIPAISWMQDILGPEPTEHRTIAAEFAYPTPHVTMRLDWRGVPYKKEYDTEPALEWDARQTTLWAATFDALAELSGTTRTDVARRLGRTGFPSSPYRIRLYRGTHRVW